MTKLEAVLTGVIVGMFVAAIAMALEHFRSKANNKSITYTRPTDHSTMTDRHLVEFYHKVCDEAYGIGRELDKRRINMYLSHGDESSPPNSGQIQIKLLHVGSEYPITFWRDPANKTRWQFQCGWLGQRTEASVEQEAAMEEALKVRDELRKRK